MKPITGLSRRHFLQGSTAVAGLSMMGSLWALGNAHAGAKTAPGPIEIAAVSANFERETLVRPFGFKGGYMTEIWQTMAMLESARGTRKVGLCTQNVLWSDARVFADHSESGGNALMFALSEYALQLVKGRSSKIHLLNHLF